MTAQQFIEQRLGALKAFHPKSVTEAELPGEILGLLLSKKFRKYSANETLIAHIKNAIHIHIQNRTPINITFPHGAYKLWRLPEAPYPDWAELFAIMYFTTWLKPICEIYEPGIWFDFFVDDLILPHIDNISSSEVKRYLEAYQKLLSYLKTYQPKNLNMTITTFASVFPKEKSFDQSLKEHVEIFKATNPVFSERSLHMVELNARPTELQLQDPQWKEKILEIHDAYMVLKREVGYHYAADKILVFNQPLPNGMFLAVGTTKTSVAKFWVGIGALKKDGESYKEYILSPKQINTLHLMHAQTKIPGLQGKNFETISILE